MWARNIPNWDDFDSVLDFLLNLDAAHSVREVVAQLLAVSNEHRMLVSRLIFAATFGIWGHVNFTAITVLGDLFILAVVGFLVARAEAGLPRLRLAAILGAGIFQLQHWENFFWGGSSIDHFFVVLASVVALGAVLVPGRGMLAVGCVSGFLATFSLAHGLVVWPVGGLFLLAARRRRAALGWAAAAALTIALFFAGFQFNSGHLRPGLADLPRVVVFWLTLLGSSPALDNPTVAPWLGLLLVIGVALTLGRRLQEREFLAGAVVCWCLGSLAMIAWGRALLSDPETLITSRYMILSSLAWAMGGWVVLERRLVRGKFEALGTVLLLAALVAFDFSTNQSHAGEGRCYTAPVEWGARIFLRDGTFGDKEILYPDPLRADAILRAAAARHIYHLPDPATLPTADAEQVRLREPTEIANGLYFIEKVENTPAEVWVKGWAFRPAHRMKLGEIAVVFRSAGKLVAFKATPTRRPDVAKVYHRWDVNHAGFEVRVPGGRLPPGPLQVGVCFDWDGKPEYMMTSSLLEVRP